MITENKKKPNFVTFINRKCLKANSSVKIKKKKKTLVADLGFNFMGCAISLTREYKWNWGSRGGGGSSAPQKLIHSELIAV